jgi:hypothetical protein
LLIYFSGYSQVMPELANIPHRSFGTREELTLVSMAGSRIDEKPGEGGPSTGKTNR